MIPLSGTGSVEDRTWDLILERAKEWREVAKELDDPFLKFTVEYIAFNALCRAKYGYRLRDWKIMENIKEEIPQNQISRDKIQRLKEIAPIRNVRNARRDRGRSSLTAEELEDYKNVIEAVYWIRNNLFHGDKIYSFEKDQNLVEVGYEILLDINNWLVEEISRKERGPYEV